MARARQKGAGTPATVALQAAGVAYEAHPYEHDPRAESYGLEAAEALGVEPGRVFKTLMAQVQPGGASRPELVVGIVPVDRQLDLKALARALDASKAAMAAVADAERATGYVAGGISPVGQRKAHRTVVDASALTHPTVFVSGGKRGLDIELAPDDLMTVTGASVADIAR
jgi:Cys-tRNA(Pro)/Cys-tRNA(Cys) deacylase